MRGAILGMVLLTCAPLAAAGPAPTTKAELQDWIRQGRAAEAYEALTAVESANAPGSLDYLIGLAALATERNTEAASRLGAYVRRNPSQDPPRFDLALALEKLGRRDEAAKQYWIIQAHSPSRENQERAAAELARFEAVPVIPVKELEEEKPLRKPPQFARDEPELGGRILAGGGYDSNANMSPGDVDRFFYFDVLREQQKPAETAYLNLAATANFAAPLSQHLSWRNAASVNGRENPSAHFADSQNASIQTALRWGGATQRLTGGLAYSEGWIDEDEFDNELAATALLETLTPILHFGFGFEGARLRFPAAPIRDVNSLYVRGRVERAPFRDMVWLPSLSLFAGEESEKVKSSPFGRAVWGLSASLARRFGKAFQAEATADVGESHYSGFFTQSERREDHRLGFSAFVHWQLSEESHWTLSGGGRYVRNRSNEPLYDASRGTVGLEISRSFGTYSSDPELLIAPE